MNLATALESTLPELNNRLTVWNDRVHKEFGRLFDWNDIPGGTSTEVHLQECWRVAQERVGAGPVEEVSAFLDELCLAYLQAAARQQGIIRAAMGRARVVLEWLQAYIAQAADRLRATRAVDWLRLGLAGAAIEDNRIDFRDMFGVLGELHLATVAVGIDPRPYFREIAALASNRKGGECSMGEFLVEFHRSAFFQSLSRRQRSIRPKGK